MALQPLLIAGVFLVIIVALWFILGTVARGLRTIISSILLILVISGTAYLYWDSTSLAANFGTQDKLFVYVDAGRLQAGFDTTTGTPIIHQELTAQRAAYVTNDLNGLRGGAYKLLIFHKGSFDTVASVNLSGTVLTRDQAITLLESPTAKSDYVAIYIQQHHINGTIVNDNALGNDDNVKGLIFAGLVGELSKTGDLTLMTRTGTLTIYPDSGTLWLIRTMPSVLIPYLVETKQIQ